MNCLKYYCPLVILLFLNINLTFGQGITGVYVDKQGVLRWQKNNTEATFFGVNYTTPFAYAYRAHKTLNTDLEKAIDQDVYHLARLGINAFRVRVWDTEITDSLGNLLENEHLRLYDYLLFKLKERHIKIMLTPIAFWGNGYPERDAKTAGFSSIYNKQRALVNEFAIKAQEKYLTQLFRHVNPYTKTTYQNDPDVIAAEVNNEPHHSGPKAKTTEYVNRMVKAIRGTGWTEPIFYNISESPRYADAVAKANIGGISFQWYPSGLVANRTLQGNFLPHVDRYHIPFDTIPQYRNKARMVYEFDAGDILQPIMYPAIARSFRAAGFQWATQFAYDPLALAYANTEYQTHYLNLAYTPAKAISLLIAAKAFHKLPRLKTYGTYPQDSVFDAFRVSYRESLSEMNTAQEFYYTGTTRTKPVALNKLQHLAGVGSSPVINYQGYGVYFLDKLETGVWRLEVMPDAIQIHDPFVKASPQKEVTRIQYQAHPMQINLPDLGTNSTLKGINKGINYSAMAEEGSSVIQPGTYLISRKGKENNKLAANSKLGVIQLNEFVAPKPFSNEPFVVHEPLAEISAGKSFLLKIEVVGVQEHDKISVQLTGNFGSPQLIPLQRVSAYDYQVEVPAEVAVLGMLNYRIIVQKLKEEYFVFPGNYKGSPWAWDNYHYETWQTFVAAPNGAIALFDANRDKNIYTYPSWGKGIESKFISGEVSGQLIYRATAQEPTPEKVVGFQHYFGDKIKGRFSELSNYTKLVIRARSTNSQALPVNLALITADAAAYAAPVTLTSNFQEIEIPLVSLKPDSFMLSPRPYPGFHPFWFKTDKSRPFQVAHAERLEIRFTQNITGTQQPLGFEVAAVWLKN